MDLADAAADHTRSAWDRARRRYSVTVDDNPNRSRKRLKVGYQPQDRKEAKEIISRLRALYKQCVEPNLYGVSLVIETLENGRLKYENLENYKPHGNAKGEYYTERVQSERAREDFDFDAWAAAGYPLRENWNPD